MPAPSSLDGLSVLVIDDDEAIRIAICELLAGWGCLCRAVDSEAEALAVSDSFTPDLLLADYRLRGDRTGLQATEAIRARLGRQVPAIIVTGDTAADRLRDVHTEGETLLHKPVVAEALQAAMLAKMREHGWCGRRRRRTEAGRAPAPGSQIFGMCSALLTMRVPDSANSSTSGCRSAGPRLHTPPGSASPIRSRAAHRASTAVSSTLVGIGVPSK